MLIAVCVIIDVYLSLQNKFEAFTQWDQSYFLHGIVTETD